PAPVRVAVLSAERIPIFQDKTAVTVTPAGEAWLAALQPGKIARVEVAAGQRVKLGQVLVAMEMPPKEAKQLEQAKAGATRAGQVYEKARAARRNAVRWRDSSRIA
ncbi:MAG: biotin/lipoyl-binding protein, partial [Deltaproteobacteria bacterium]|nr:biotin/lipoyl-binding protein [Deltaproteobacteria bacterium]